MKLALLMLAACSESATIGDGYHTVVRTMTDPPSKLDVLFVVDDSVSITDDQQALIDAARSQLFPQLPADLHVGVVSTSITIPNSFGGAGGCDGIALPDGKLIVGDWPSHRGCSMVSDAFLATDGTVANFTGELGDAFACMAEIGHQGCGIEQPLEAMRLALTLPDNAGFLRDDAELLVVLLTDEDDSSKLDPVAITDRSDALSVNQREYEYGVTCDSDLHTMGEHDDCVARPDTTMIAPIDSYISFLQTLKSDPAMVMVAGIVPPVGSLTTVENTLGDIQPLMIASVCTPPPGPCVDDPAMSCPRDGVAPAIRLNAFAASFPGRYALPSICDSETDVAVHHIARAVHNVMNNGTCIAAEQVKTCRAFSVDAGGSRHATAMALVADTDACDYTPTHMRADATALPGEHLEVECL